MQFIPLNCDSRPYLKMDATPIVCQWQNKIGMRRHWNTSNADNVHYHGKKCIYNQQKTYFWVKTDTIKIYLRFREWQRLPFSCNLHWFMTLSGTCLFISDLFNWSQPISVIVFHHLWDIFKAFRRGSRFSLLPWLDKGLDVRANQRHRREHTDQLATPSGTDEPISGTRVTWWNIAEAQI